jgi:small subunit ribosomal protein S24e
MKIDIVDQRRNELLKRKELKFTLNHDGAGTPGRHEVRQKIADLCNSNVEKVYIIKMDTKTGRMVTVGKANIYDTVEISRSVEPKHIILRNTPKTKAQE